MTELGYSHGTTAADTNDRALAKVRDALSGLRYGEVTVVVQDGVWCRWSAPRRCASHGGDRSSQRAVVEQ